MTADKKCSEERAWGVDSVFISVEGFVDKDEMEKTLATAAHTLRKIKYQQVNLRKMWQEPLSGYKRNCGCPEDLTIDGFLMLRRLINFHIGHCKLFRLYFVLNSIIPFVKEEEWGIRFTEDGNVRIENGPLFNAWQGGDMKREILLFRQTDALLTEGSESLLYKAACACKDLGVEEKQNTTR